MASVAGAGMAASAVSAYIQCIDLPMPPIVFQYNPEAFTIQTKGEWAFSTQPATQGSPPMWKGATLPDVTVKILMDAFSIPPIPPQATIQQLRLLTLPTPQSMVAGIPAPSRVIFGWGPNVIMKQAIIMSVSVSYERFLLGVPVRATATLLLRAYPMPSPLGPTNPSSGGLTSLRTRTVVEGDTLASIAFEEYDDPNKWRALAEVNKIDDPMRIKLGTLLIVPERREAENLS